MAKQDESPQDETVETPPDADIEAEGEETTELDDVAIPADSPLSASPYNAPGFGMPEELEDDALDVNSEVSRLISLVQTQQETIDYLVQYIERVEAQLNDRVDAMELAGPVGPAAPAPSATPTTIDWSSLSGPRRLKAWHDLSEFVEGLVGRFSIQLEVLPCWWQHGDAVEELTALWQARNVAFAPNADASMASWWQDLLERSRHRLRGIFGSCRDGHVPVRHAIWMNDEIRAAMEEAVEAEVEAFGG